MKRRLLALAFTSLLFTSVVVGLFTATAAAYSIKLNSYPGDITGSNSNVTFQWKNMANITGNFPDGGAVNFFDYNGLVDFWTQHPGAFVSGTPQNIDQPTCGGSTSKITVTSSSNPGSGQLNLVFASAQAAAGGCQTPNPVNIHITQTQNADIMYTFSGNELQRADGDTGFVFKQSPQYPNVYLKENGPPTCPDEIVYNGDGTGNLYQLKTGSGGNLPASAHAEGCVNSGNHADVLTGPQVAGQSGYGGVGSVKIQSDGSVIIHIGGTPPATPPSCTGSGSGSCSTPPGGCTGSGSGSGSCSTQASCESSGGPLAWIVCSVGEYIADAETSIEHVITNLLKTQPINFSCASSNSCPPGDDSGEVYAVWSSFRLYADIVLVIALLAVVFAEAAGGGLIDAYTAKKMLPRILVAAILINLSIYLVAGLEDITNVIGGGVESFIEAPFHLSGAAFGINGTFAIHVSGGTGLVVFTSLFTGVLAAGITEGIAGILLAVVGLGLLAALGVLITIMLRQTILVLLVLISPIAFALYCLPNTEQYFKKWWDLLLKTLMVYPIVAVVFAAANISGVVLSNLDSGVSPQILAELMSFIALIMPLFLIPFAFKISGGAIGSLAGAVSSLRSRASQPINNALKKRAADRFQRAQNHTLWNPNRKIGKRNIGKSANSLASWATSPGSNLAYSLRNVPGFSGTGNKVAARIHAARMEQSSNLLKEMNETGMFNDKAYRALSGAHEGFSEATRARLQAAGLYGKAPTSVGDIEKISRILGQSDSTTERIGANALEGFKGRLGSLYSDPEMGKASIEAAGIMGLASHGFAGGRDLAYVANDISANGKDLEFAQSVVSRAQVLGQQQRPDIKAGYGVDYQGGRFVSGVDETGGPRALQLIKTLSSHDLAAAKGDAIKALRPTVEQTLGGGGNEAKAVEEQLFSWAGPYSQASVAVKAEALDIIDRQSGGRQPVRDENGNVRTDNNGNPITAYAAGTIGERFDNMRRAETDPTRRGLGGPEPGGGDGGGPAGPEG